MAPILDSQGLVLMDSVWQLSGYRVVTRGSHRWVGRWSFIEALRRKAKHPFGRQARPPPSGVYELILSFERKWVRETCWLSAWFGVSSPVFPRIQKDVVLFVGSYRNERLLNPGWCSGIYGDVGLSLCPGHSVRIHPLMYGPSFRG